MKNRFWGLTKRNLIETLRDPITLILGLGLPLFLLVLFSVINMSVDMPIDMFDVKVLAPGIAVFSFSMLMMSEANLIASDRTTSLFDRLNTLPLKTSDFMLAYAIPYLIIGVGQYIVTFLVAFCFGLNWTPHVFTSFLVLFPTAIIFVALGLMMGLSLNVNQVVGIGNGIIILVAILSGAWMPLEMIGGAIEGIAKALPFYNAVGFSRNLITGASVDWINIAILAAYTVAVAVISWFVSGAKLKTK